MVVELATEMATMGHEVTVRLPYKLPYPTQWRGVKWVDEEVEYDIAFRFDDYAHGSKSDILVACRSDPPAHERFRKMVFLSRTHAEHCGYAGAEYIGGGVRLRDYPTPLSWNQRIPRRVLFTSSLDRAPSAVIIGKAFDFVTTYRGQREVERDELIRLQRLAKVLIHPCEPVRPSEFFCMSVLEALAAGTPVIASDADALKELWGRAAITLPLPIRYREWMDTIEYLLYDIPRWENLSSVGREVAKEYDWSLVARKYLEVAGVT